MCQGIVKIIDWVDRLVTLDAITEQAFNDMIPEGDSRTFHIGQKVVNVNQKYNPWEIIDEINAQKEEYDFLGV